jgi:UDP-glucuronate 4-epimerase
MDFIEAIEAACGRKAIRNYMPMQPGDVPQTYASHELLERLTDYRPSTPVTEGVKKFVDWYREHYSL